MSNALRGTFLIFSIIIILKMSVGDKKIILLKRGGGEVALFDGHQYHYRKTYKNRSSYWFCSYRKRNKCYGSITVKVTNFEVLDFLPEFLRTPHNI